MYRYSGQTQASIFQNLLFMTIPAALRLLALSLTCSLAVQAAAPAIPQEEAAVGSILLPEKIITATRLPASSISAPYAVRELTSGQIDERLPRTLPEALRETPGVSVQKTSNGQGSPHIRGFTGFRTLAMIDGVR
jgi:hemoglobin/transferrin/lactoferrin receptor protein